MYYARTYLCRRCCCLTTGPHCPRCMDPLDLIEAANRNRAALEAMAAFLRGSEAEEHRQSNGCVHGEGEGLVLPHAA